MDTLPISLTASVTAAQPAATAPARPADKPGVAVRVHQPADDKKKSVETAAPEDHPPERDSRSLQFLVQDNQVITTIVDDQSKKVIVQIPDAELIRIAKSIDRMQGFFIEQKA